MLTCTPRPVDSLMANLVLMQKFARRYGPGSSQLARRDPQKTLIGNGVFLRTPTCVRLYAEGVVFRFEDVGFSSNLVTIPAAIAGRASAYTERFSENMITF